MAAVREARLVWEGDLSKGSGKVSASTSKSFSDLGVSWAARTEGPEGKTSPEELLAAAHASCFAMAFAARLGRAGFTPQRMDVTATVTFDKVGEGWKVVSSALDVRGTVPNVDEATFKETAEGAKDNCPISTALKGNVELSVTATLV